MDLTKVKTCDLVEELKTRLGVQAEYAEPHEMKEISVEGPACVLVVTD